MITRLIISFNPCFDGSEARAGGLRAHSQGYLIGFNPCFDGSEARADSFHRGRAVHSVSILVLMEVKREPKSNWTPPTPKRFQSLF